MLAPRHRAKISLLANLVAKTTNRELILIEHLRLRVTTQLINYKTESSAIKQPWLQTVQIDRLNLTNSLHLSSTADNQFVAGANKLANCLALRSAP